MATQLDPTTPAKLAGRPNSPLRWQLAYQRAIDEGLQAFTVNGSPLLWAVTAGSVSGMVYSVEIIPGEHPTCGCPAAVKAGDKVCKHRALALSRLGMLPVAPSIPANVTPIASGAALAMTGD